MNTKALLEPMGSWAWWRSWFLIFLGCSIMGTGFVLFINPYKLVPGGVYGMGIVLHNIFPSIQVGTFGYMFDIPLMLISALVFGGGFGTRTVLAALYTPGFMNILTRLVYPSPEAVEALDPSQLLGGRLDLSNDLLLGFAGVMMTRSLALGHHAATAVMMCLPLAAMLVFAMQIAREHEQGALGALLLGALCAAAMLARVSFLERSSGDYEIYLADWLQKLAGGSFAEGMRQNIGEYNVLYQYILFVITRLPVPSLYAVKAVSFIGDAFLAGAAATLAQKDGKKSAAAFGLALLLPTVALNGGMFAQCDSLYAACALWGLALALERKSAGAAACFALSLAFKLQAVFLLPMVAVLWADRKLRLSDALVFLAALAATALPALLGGKSIGALLSIYTAQTGLYTGLTYNAPSFFALMNTTGLDVYAYGNFGMALAFGACALLVACGVKQAGKLTREGYLRLALLLPLAIVFFLPRMHERYFYLADILSAVLAAKDKKAAPICALVALASLGSYWETALPLSFCALMMFAALILTLRHTQREENVI